MFKNIMALDNEIKQRSNSRYLNYIEEYIKRTLPSDDNTPTKYRNKVDNINVNLGPRNSDYNLNLMTNSENAPYIQRNEIEETEKPTNENCYVFESTRSKFSFFFNERYDTNKNTHLTNHSDQINIGSRKDDNLSSLSGGINVASAFSDICERQRPLQLNDSGKKILRKISLISDMKNQISETFPNLDFRDSEVGISPTTSKPYVTGVNFYGNDDDNKYEDPVALVDLEDTANGESYS